MSKHFLVLFISLVTLIGQAQTTKVVRGNIIDLKTENPVEKLELSIFTTDSTLISEAETDDEGNFAFSNVPFGKYHECGKR